MDALENPPRTAGIAPRTNGARSILFLQGPISSFFDRLGRALIARGHRVYRINLHLGDQLFWHLPATNFRGDFTEWRDFVAAFLDRHQISDLILHGDRRPYHIVAAEEARARGIPVLATDLGYLRPDWITLEYDGMTTYSRFPRDRDAIHELAEKFQEPELGPRFHTPFWLIASRDVAYNLGLVFGRPLYPHYRYHSTVHPFVEYAGWIWSRPQKWLRSRSSAQTKRDLQAAPGTYFLVPLQLTTDFQIRAHSPYSDLREAVREIIASFVASGSRRKLVFVVHPLDNGVVNWRKVIGRQAEAAGAAERIFARGAGTPMDLLRNAAGVVTVNSTVGITALCNRIPVKALGNAIFDIAGLTCRVPLASFWHEPEPPDPQLLAAFLRALVGTTQIKGGYYERASQDCAIAGFIDRLERRPHPLPSLSASEQHGRTPRPIAKSKAVIGVADAVGIGLARELAAPGVRLLLAATDRTVLARVADDCRYRGAVVDELPLPARNITAALGALETRTDSPAQAFVLCGPEAFARDVDEALDAIEFIGGAGRRFVVIEEDVGSGPAVIGGIRSAAEGVEAGRQRLLMLRAAGVAVSVVTPARAAWRLAALLRAPEIARISPANAAEAIVRHAERDGIIALPGRATALRAAFRCLATRGRGAVGKLIAPAPAREPETHDRTALASAAPADFADD